MTAAPSCPPSRGRESASVSLMEMMGVREFIISWVSTRMSCCQASISCCCISIDTSFSATMSRRRPSMRSSTVERAQPSTTSLCSAMAERMWGGRFPGLSPNPSPVREGNFTGERPEGEENRVAAWFIQSMRPSVVQTKRAVSTFSVSCRRYCNCRSASTRRVCRCSFSFSVSR